MITDAIENLVRNLIEKGYLTQRETGLPGIRSLLYARSPKAFSLGFAKVEDHFLFVDWEMDAFSRLDTLLEIHKRFSQFVNQGFRVPHAMRMRIPNIAVVALSEREFQQEAIDYVFNHFLIPIMGGEVGQLILVDVKNRLIHSHTPRQFKQTGSIPLRHAVEAITNALEPANAIQ